MNRNCTSLLALLAASVFSAAPAIAQGADDCANALAISGMGVFPFDNTGAVTDGAFDCDADLPVRRDVWFQWTAQTTGSRNVHTCGTQVAFKTRIGVYEGTACLPGAPLDCNSDNCGDYTSVFFQAIAGQDYLIRVGSKAPGTEGSGTFTIDETCPGTNDDAFEDNDTCASPIVMVDGTYNALYVDKGDPDYFSFDVPDGSTLDVGIGFMHNTGDIDVFLWDTCGGVVLDDSQSGNNNESISWTNNTGGSVTAVMRIEHWLPDDNGDCQNYDLTVSGTGACTNCDIGSRYCTPASNNSTGAPAAITLSGSDVVADNDLTLTADGLPPNSIGYFITGLSNNTFIPPGAAGSFCVGGSGFARFLPVIDSGAGGTMTFQPDLNDFPRFGAIMPGSFFHFQGWYQDGTTSNFTDAVALTFN